MQPIYKRVPIYLQNQVMACIRENLLQANLFFKREYCTPKIVYKQKGSIAGSAYLTRWEIQLNSQLLCENESIFIDEVVPHELAHLVTFKEFGRVKPHGKEWQYVMSTVFGKNPKTTHNFIVAKPSFVYACQCQEHHLSKIRHNKIQSAQKQYLCCKCGVTLQFKAQLETH